MFSLEIELIEGGKQELNDTCGQGKDHDGVRVMMEGVIEMELVDNKLVETLVFNLPTRVTVDRQDGPTPHPEISQMMVALQACVEVMEKIA